MKQFSDLTEEEREELRESMRKRAKEEGTDLLENVICLPLKYFNPDEYKENK